MNLKKIGITISILIFLYTIAGFWGVPYLARKKAVETIDEMYQTHSEIEEIKFNPYTFEFELKNLKIPGDAGKADRLSLTKFYANLEIWPVLKKEISFQSVSLNDTAIDFQILKNSETNWTPKVKKEETTDSDDKDKKPWQLTLKSIELNNTKLKLSDFTHREELVLPLGPISLKAENISTSIGSTTDLKTLNISLGNAGQLSLSGSGKLQPAYADVQFKATDVPIDFLTSYLSDKTILAIQSGQYSGAGKIVYENGNIKLIATSQIKDFKVTEQTGKVPVALWKNLEINNLQYQSKPLKIRIEDVIFHELSTTVTLKKNGELNFKKFLLEKKTAPDQKIERTSETSSIKPPEAEKPPLDLLIENVSLVDSKVFYSDLQIIPNFSAQISDLNGTIAPVTLESDKKIKVKLKGRVESQGKFTGDGFYMTSGNRPNLNLKMNFNNIEMTTFTPYSGKFMGWEISKGKLFLNLSYALKNHRIKGTNNATLDQFSLGKRVETDSAINLPVKLALALLKDREGKIKLNLPVEGDLDSPKFKFGTMIWTAIKNVIIKIATAPFDFLKGLLGGGDDMDSIFFNLGTTELMPEQEKKIDGLVKFLTERPNLTVEIQGHYLPADAEPLKKVLRKREITEDQLKKLATERGQKVMSLLISKNIEAERLYLMSSTPEEKPEVGARVLLVLKNKE